MEEPKKPLTLDDLRYYVDHKPLTLDDLRYYVNHKPGKLTEEEINVFESLLSKRYRHTEGLGWRLQVLKDLKKYRRDLTRAEDLERQLARRIIIRRCC